IQRPPLERKGAIVRKIHLAPFAGCRDRRFHGCQSYYERYLSLKVWYRRGTGRGRGQASDGVAAHILKLEPSRLLLDWQYERALWQATKSESASPEVNNNVAKEVVRKRLCLFLTSSTA